MFLNSFFFCEEYFEIIEMFFIVEKGFFRFVKCSVKIDNSYSNTSFHKYLLGMTRSLLLFSVLLFTENYHLLSECICQFSLIEPDIDYIFF